MIPEEIAQTVARQVEVFADIADMVDLQLTAMRAGQQEFTDVQMRQLRASLKGMTGLGAHRVAPFLTMIIAELMYAFDEHNPDHPDCPFLIMQFRQRCGAAVNSLERQLTAMYGQDPQ